MKQAIDAVYEKGTFRPIGTNFVHLPEGQRVRITVEYPAHQVLKLAAAVYAGLSADEIDEVEKIATQRGDFFGTRSGD
jgi:predicted DNA-binding antitoxin AbrB/MazE fold protein